MSQRVLRSSSSPQGKVISLATNLKVLEQGKHGVFIVFDKSEVMESKYTSLDVVNDSMKFCKFYDVFKIECFQLTPNASYCSKLIVNDDVLCEATGVSPHAAKEHAAQVLLHALKQEFYTIKVVKEKKLNAIVITMDTLKEFSSHCNDDEDSDDTTSLPSECNLDMSDVSVTEIFCEMVKCVFEDYIISDVTCDLIFAGFESDVMETIKSVFNKKGTKYSKHIALIGENTDAGESWLKYAIDFDPQTLFPILKKSGGRLGKYVLEPPTCSVKNW